MSIRDSEKEAEFLEMKSSTYPTSNSGESLTKKLEQTHQDLRTMLTNYQFRHSKKQSIEIQDLRKVSKQNYKLV